MATIPFELPSLGADMDEGTLLEWRVKPGDVVKRGQVVAVVDTSKAAVDVEIWQEGVVEALVVEPGTKIPVGTVMMTLQPVGSVRAPAAPAAPARSAAVPEAVVAPSPVAAPVAPPTPAPAPTPAAAPVPAPAPAPPPAPAAAPVPSTTARPSAAPSRLPDAHALIEASRHPVSPAARKRAHELDVDADRLVGTGPHGSVVVADVERAAAERTTMRAVQVTPLAPDGGSATRTGAPAAAADAAGTGAAPSPADRQAAMRAAIAAAMGRSKREIPHYYLTEPIPMQAALDWLRTHNESVPIADRVLPAALLLKAVARALARVPELNGTMQGGAFRPSAAVHAGVAIALRGGGLVAPGIHDVQDKGLARLMRDLSDLVRRARAGSLRSSEMSDPTITVTQLGDQGVESVHPVIYPPQVAIVGFGRIAERPWAQDGWVRALPVVTATLAADHRVSDGHRGALFLAELRELLQRPATIDPTPERGSTDGP